ncbi:hypothetical protein [Fastidiosibacter lacustris]|uniref:hypothetical protein n=1 Tax=Fastidiosibacter lacustris TaxID=2056695 RepID=UPI000E351F40|nr:hypothetical protein [Fastidiosibacter lacustris]
MKKVLFIHNSSNEDDKQLVTKLGFDSQKLQTIGVDFVKKSDMQIWTTVGVERFETISQSYLQNTALLVFSPNISVPNAEEYAKKNSVPSLHLQKGDQNLSGNNLIELMQEALDPLTIQKNLSNFLLNKSYLSKTHKGEPLIKNSGLIATSVLPFLTRQSTDKKMLAELQKKNHEILKNGSPANNIEQKLTNLLQFIHSHTAVPEEVNSQLSTYTYKLEHAGQTYNVPWSVMQAYDPKSAGNYDSTMVINRLKQDLAKVNASDIIAQKLLSPMYGVLWNNKHGVSTEYIETLKSSNALYKEIKYSDKKESNNHCFTIFSKNNNNQNIENVC